MAVRLLAGPFDLKPHGAKPDWEGNVAILAWFPKIGMIGGTSLGEWYATASGVVTLDGLYADRSTEHLHEVSWWPAQKRMVNMHWTIPDIDTYEITYDQFTFSRQRTGPAHETPDPDHPLKGKRYIKLVDRSIYFDHLHHTLIGVAPDKTETPEGPFIPFVNGGVYPGRSDTELLVSERFTSDNPSEADSQCVFYDTVTRKFSTPFFHIGMGSRSLFCATDWNVLVSDHVAPEGSKYAQLRVWSLETHPTIMTPVELMMGVVKAGYIAHYRVRVTGDHDDPAVDELVNWSVSGAGTLLEYQSRTDAEGYAVTRVQYGLDESGSSEVFASLLC